jgi:hypothetical protein
MPSSGTNSRGTPDALDQQHRRSGAGRAAGRHFASPDDRRAAVAVAALGATGRGFVRRARRTA